MYLLLCLIGIKTRKYFYCYKIRTPLTGRGENLTNLYVCRALTMLAACVSASAFVTATETPFSRTRVLSQPTAFPSNYHVEIPSRKPSWKTSFIPFPSINVPQHPEQRCFVKLIASPKYQVLTPFHRTCAEYLLRHRQGPRYYL